MADKELEALCNDWKREQLRLSSLRRGGDNEKQSATQSFGDIRLVAGLDITPLDPHADQGWPFGPQPAIACMAICRLPELDIVYQDLIQVQLEVPYLSTYLGFREIPAFTQLISRANAAQWFPDLYMIDGYGVLHPRRCGSATHLGVALNIPTVGVAKNVLHVDGITTENTRSIVAQALESREDNAALVIPLKSDQEAKEVLGAAVCQAGNTRPIFVSVGHLVSLETAAAVVLTCCKYRIPEPIRQADILSREAARKASS